MCVYIPRLSYRYSVMSIVSSLYYYTCYRVTRSTQHRDCSSVMFLPNTIVVVCCLRVVTCMFTMSFHARGLTCFSYLGSSFENGVVSIFMQYAAGGSLDSILRKFGPLGESITARYTLQLLNAVAYLHDLHIVHR